VITMDCLKAGYRVRGTLRNHKDPKRIEELKDTFGKYFD